MYYMLLWIDPYGHQCWDKFETLAECEKGVENLVKNMAVDHVGRISMIRCYDIEFGVETHVDVYTYDSKKFGELD